MRRGERSGHRRSRRGKGRLAGHPLAANRRDRGHVRFRPADTPGDSWRLGGNGRRRRRLARRLTTKAVDLFKEAVDVAGAPALAALAVAAPVRRAVAGGPHLLGLLLVTGQLTVLSAYLFRFTPDFLLDLERDWMSVGR